MKRMLIPFLFIMLISFRLAAQSEISLNLSNMVMGFSEYHYQTNLFKDRYTGLQNFTHLQKERVSYEAIAAIKEAMGENHSQHYISGLKIYYGLTQLNEIILYFVPFYCNRINTTGDVVSFEILQPANGFEGLLEDDNYEIYYAYNGALYNLRDDGIELAEAPINIARYRFDVTTKPGYAMKEAYAAFVPFQEIETLYNDNRNTEYNTGNIYFNSAATFSDNKYTHRLILTTITNYAQPYENNNNFTGMAANLVQTCPICCDLLTYTIQ